MTGDHQHGAAHDHADPNAHLFPTEYWEQRYTDSERIWSGKVNATMAAVVSDFTPGSAVDLGCGEDGDVLWLAEQGWQAISATAVDRARSEAAARGLKSASLTATDLSTGQPEAGSVDLVTASFFQSSVALERIEILRCAASAIRSGGHPVVVSHAQPPPWPSHRGPNMISARDDAAELALSSTPGRSRPPMSAAAQPSAMTGSRPS